MNPNNTYTNPTTGQTFKEGEAVLYDGHRWIISGINRDLARVELSSNTRYASLRHEKRQNIRKPFFHGLGGQEIPVGTEVVSGGTVYRVEAVGADGAVRLATRNGYSVTCGGSIVTQDPILKNATPTQASYTNEFGTFRVGDVLDTSAGHPKKVNYPQEPLQIAAIGGGRVWLRFADGTPYRGLGADSSYSVGATAGMRHAPKPCAAEAKKVEELSKELASMKQKLEQEKALRFAASYGGIYSGAGAALGKTEIVGPALTGSFSLHPRTFYSFDLETCAKAFAPKPTPVPFCDKDGIDIQVGDFIRRPHWKGNTGDGWHEVVAFENDTYSGKEPGMRLKQRGYRSPDQRGSWYPCMANVYEVEDRTFTNAKDEVLKVGDRVVLKVNPEAHYIISRIRSNGRVWLEVKHRHSGDIGKVDGGGAQQAVRAPFTDLTLYVPTVTITRTVTYTGTPEQIARFQETKKEQEFRYGGQQLNFRKGSTYTSGLSGVRMTVTDLTETSK